MLIKVIPNCIAFKLIRLPACSIFARGLTTHTENHAASDSTTAGEFISGEAEPELQRQTNIATTRGRQVFPEFVQVENASLQVEVQRTGGPHLNTSFATQGLSTQVYLQITEIQQ